MNSSLCKLSVSLCLCGYKFRKEHHRDTENTESAQRKTLWRLS